MNMADDLTDLVTNALGVRPAAAAHARLYLASGSGASWDQCAEGIGAVANNTVYLVSPDDLTVLWQQRLYVGLAYHADTPKFHSFEGDSHVLGIAFANQAHASKFAAAVMSLVPPAPAPVAAPVVSVTPVPVAVSTGSNSPPSAKKEKSMSLFGSSKKSSKKDKSSAKPAFNKSLISAPQDFRHVSGMKLGDDGRFVVTNLKPEWRDAIVAAGITEDMLQDAGTRKAVLKKLKAMDRANAGATTNDVVARPSHAPPPVPPSTVSMAHGLPTKAPPPIPPSSASANVHHHPIQRPMSMPPPPPSSSALRSQAPPPLPPSRSTTAASPPTGRRGPPPPPPARANRGPPPPPPVRRSASGLPPPVPPSRPQSTVMPTPPVVPPARQAPPPALPPARQAGPPPLPTRNVPTTPTTPSTPPPPPPVVAVTPATLSGGPPPPPPPPPPPMAFTPTPLPASRSLDSADTTPSTGGGGGLPAVPDSRSDLMESIRAFNAKKLHASTDGGSKGMSSSASVPSGMAAGAAAGVAAGAALNPMAAALVDVLNRRRAGLDSDSEDEDEEDGDDDDDW